MAVAVVDVVDVAVVPRVTPLLRVMLKMLLPLTPKLLLQGLLREVRMEKEGIAPGSVLEEKDALVLPEDVVEEDVGEELERVKVNSGFFFLFVFCFFLQTIPF